MNNIFFAADHHFQHSNILKFRNKNGAFIRPFKSIEDHDEHIIGRHNAVVTDDDTVYLLGDLAWKTNSRTKEILRSLKGNLVLVGGNHDHMKWLSKFVNDFHVWKYLPEHSMILSHVPLNGEDIQRSGFNVHGHEHEKVRAIDIGNQQFRDPRYLCVSMEQIEFTPISIDLVIKARETLCAPVNAKLKEMQANAKSTDNTEV